MNRTPEAMTQNIHTQAIVLHPGNIHNTPPLMR